MKSEHTDTPLEQFLKRDLHLSEDQSRQIAEEMDQAERSVARADELEVPAKVLENVRRRLAVELQSQGRGGHGRLVRWAKVAAMLMIVAGAGIYWMELRDGPVSAPVSEPVAVAGGQGLEDSYELWELILDQPEQEPFAGPLIFREVASIWDELEAEPENVSRKEHHDENSMEKNFYRGSGGLLS